MIIITDRKRLLNLNHFAIFLMLTPVEKALYGGKLRGLNKYSTLTKGIFHFYMVVKGDTPYDNLPDEMIRNMSYFNVMVRVVNTIRITYCYGMERIDFEADIDSIVERLKVFVEQVCEMDIFHLDILNQRFTPSSRMIAKYYRENNIVKEMFEAALKGEKVNKNEGKKLLQKTSNTTDVKTSLGIAKSAVDNENEIRDSKIEKERCEREKPRNTPHITMTVKMVNTDRVLKDGSIKKKLGVEMNIDGYIIPVFFVSTDQTFLYIITLISQYEGRSVKRSDFLPLAGIIKDGIDSVKIQNYRKWFENWLRIRYDALHFSRDFDYWYRGVKEDPHPLDVAISGIKRTLWEILKDNFKDAYYYCLIANVNGRYRINISSDNIRIDPEIMRKIYE